MAQFVNRFSNLPDSFFQKLEIPSNHRPSLFLWNQELADNIEFPTLNIPQDEIEYFLTGRSRLNSPYPLAQSYSGHQFGHFNPNLGDGRACLIAEIKTSDQRYYDVHAKGTGATQFSRRGDGKATLASAIREFVVSESMHTLGIPTTRSLAICRTNETVLRDFDHPGAIITRIARSHIRFGTFEQLKFRNQMDDLKTLVKFWAEQDTLTAAQPRDSANIYRRLYQDIVTRQAQLIAKWMAVGFIHGVMNTDNCLISGETIDYGPCSFMENFNPKMVLSQIDQNGRYCYENQPSIMRWNLSVLADCFFDLIDGSNQEKNSFFSLELARFNEEFFKYYHNLMARKLGFKETSPMVQEHISLYLNLMEKFQVDFTLGFYLLSHIVSETIPNFSKKLNHIYNQYRDHKELEDFFKDYLKSIKKSGNLEKAILLLKRTNPIAIPRNHLVEEVISQAYESNSPSSIEKWIQVLRNPYLYQTDSERYYLPATIEERVPFTHCNT